MTRIESRWDALVGHHSPCRPQIRLCCTSRLPNHTHVEFAMSNREPHNMSSSKGKNKAQKQAKPSVSSSKPYIFSPQAVLAFGAGTPFGSPGSMPQSNFRVASTPASKASSAAQIPQAIPILGSGGLFGSSTTMPRHNFGAPSAPASNVLASSPFAETQTVPDPRLPASRDVE